MAREEQAMSEARLAEIKHRWRMFGEYGPTRVAAQDVRDLLAEVERLRAREAALVAVVEQVAQPPSFVALVPVYVTPEAFQQARALLASAPQEQGEA